MTNKQMKKIAKEIYELEVRRSTSVSSEEQRNIENKIIEITNKIMSLRDGMDIMLVIDTLVQKFIEKDRLEKDNYGSNET